MPHDVHSPVTIAARKVAQQEDEKITLAVENPRLIKGRDPLLISSYKQDNLYGTGKFVTTNKSTAKKICGNKFKKIITTDQKTPRTKRGAK